MAADRAADVGLSLVALADDTLQYLDRHLPPIGRVATQSTLSGTRARTVTSRRESLPRR